MVITTALIIEISGVLAAVIAIGAFVYKIIVWIQRQQHQSEDIDQIFAELSMITFALHACLDGLKQQGCNGKVTEAYNRLDEVLIQNAHQSSKNKHSEKK